MKTVKITVRATIDRQSFEGEFDSTEFSSVKDAVKHLGEEEALKFINYAQGLKDRAVGRSKLIAMHEGPLKTEWLMSREKA